MAPGAPQGDAGSPDAGSRLNVVPEEDATVWDGGGAGVFEVEEEVVEEDVASDVYQTPRLSAGRFDTVGSMIDAVGSRMSAGRFGSPSPQLQQPPQPEYTTPRLASRGGRARGFIRAGSTPPTMEKIPRANSVDHYGDKAYEHRRMWGNFQAKVSGMIEMQRALAGAAVSEREMGADRAGDGALGQVIIATLSQELQLGGTSLERPFPVMAQKSLIPRSNFRKEMRDLVLPLQVISLDVLNGDGTATVIHQPQDPQADSWGGVMSLESLFLPDFNLFLHSPDHLEGLDSLAAVIARFQEPICANLRSHYTSLSRAQEGASGYLRTMTKGGDAGDSPGNAPASCAGSEYGAESATSFASCRSQVSQARSAAKITPVHKPLTYKPGLIDEYDGACEVFKDPAAAGYSKHPISWLRRFDYLCRNAHVSPADLTANAYLYLSKEMQRKLDVAQQQGSPQGSQLHGLNFIGGSGACPWTWAQFSDWLVNVSFRWGNRERARDFIDESRQRPDEPVETFILRWEFLAAQLDQCLVMEKLTPIDYSSQVEKEKFVAKLVRSREVLQDLQMAHRHTLLAAPTAGGNFPLMLARSASGMWAAVSIKQLQGMAIRIETLSTNLQAHQAHHRSRRDTGLGETQADDESEEFDVSGLGETQEDDESEEDV